MPLVVVSPPPVLQFEDQTGKPIVGGLLFIYAGGTTSKIATYTDATGTTTNTNPIVLNLFGQAPSAIFVPPSTNIKYVLAPAGSSDPPTAPIWTVDNVAAPTTAAGTMALQSANNVSITGGTVSVSTVTSTGAASLASLSVKGNTDLDAIVTVAGAASFASTAVFSGTVTINANLNVNASIISFGPTASANASLEIQSFSPGFSAAVYLQTGSASRWALYKNTTAESGSNTGSDFQLDAYNDAGAVLSTAIKVTRSTGLVTIGSVLITGGGGLTFSGQTSGANPGNTGTLTNAPHAVPPSFWIPATVNGTSGFIPFWSA